jgi:hypothetical protein
VGEIVGPAGHPLMCKTSTGNQHDAHAVSLALRHITESTPHRSHHDKAHSPLLAHVVASSIYTYKNDVGPMYSPSKKNFMSIYAPFTGWMGVLQKLTTVLGRFDTYKGGVKIKLIISTYV